MSARPREIILLTGVNGQVGHELARSLQGLGEVIQADRALLDLADVERARQVVRDIKPTLIVNPAAYTAVDKAEEERALAMRLNAEAPAMLAEEAARLGAALLHYSTDYVFNGEKTGAYREDDTTDPRNVYGASKLAGERAIAASGCAHLILRTSWVYGTRGKNFLLTMLRLGEQRDRLSVVADQFGAPTWSRTIAELTAYIVAQSRGDSREAQARQQWWQQRSGVYHLCASGATSWHGFAEAIFDDAALPRKPVVDAIPAASYPTPAARPANSRMCLDKLEQVFGLVPPDWRDALKLCVAH
ncbi:dTDP-4-dehydrorhamnose reductase [Chitinasiproducens palmae]|uniref:dTDP-4-dehydrorhamnose reductase n=1 Tax=Chitinasiproducens palmae TaxID=1770053 RepID=A0A1H2PPL2_9BURK|nr:dTDP-4-dehydrorhamnose reductase [Chitinasiproducens palmae]SDV47833.1 dTDP-4-dehydrorhamnose reductase [Chitinasiproducens palmae]